VLTHNSTVEMNLTRREVYVTPLQAQKFTYAQSGCNSDVNRTPPRVTQFRKELADFLYRQTGVPGDSCTSGDEANW
jgi:hypothetical protein